jgi:transposase
MKKPRLTKVQVSNIVKLRKSGHSISEIGKIVSKGKSTIHHYVKNISVSGKFKVILDKKQNGSRSKQESIRDWSEAKILVREKLGKLTKRDFILIAGRQNGFIGNDFAHLTAPLLSTAIVRTNHTDPVNFV